MYESSHTLVQSSKSQLTKMQPEKTEKNPFKKVFEQRSFEFLIVSLINNKNIYDIINNKTLY